MYIMRDEAFSDILNQWDKDDTWKSIDCGFGWGDILMKCHAELLAIDPDYEVCQIKEKFGMLRYYFNPSKPEYSRKMQDVAFRYESESQYVCEVCGEPGELRNRRNKSLYVKTVCDIHYGKD